MTSPSSNPSSSSNPPAQVHELPSRLPAATGNPVIDSLNSARHITEVPCARNSLLYGIAGGLGIGVIRGLSANPMVAGNWAVGTFALISLGSWHICQAQMAQERKKVEQIIESMPRRKASSSSSTSPESS
ncbi:hypothetical protein FA13DRAFT_27639 [Coprinellus micaceus]|uniref:Cytochrome c oxidase assembly protein COX20, mitochondrial n=1 Tax=Coprinellus micaceus TaxID=71717 RepID=A0A4Y7U0L5_COPMI|nr:hypothetical protein FA13DRAFT_27639 [Coprinellus micaceus]